MSIKAVFLTGQTEITVNGLHQWDCGQQLEIHAPDLPGLVEVHFACVGMNEAVVRPCDMVGGVGTVAIPDACLEQTAPITAWVYEKDGATGTTTKTITLKVAQRARPTSSETPPPETIDQYTEAVTAMNKAVGKVTDGEITARNAIYAQQADTSTTADTDKEGNKLVDTYHLNAIRGANPKHFNKNKVDVVNIDAFCKASDCGVYTFAGSTLKPNNVTTLPDGVPEDASLKLIVEADWVEDRVYQTLKARRLSSKLDRLLIWTRQFDDGWSGWRRLVSAEELTDGTLVPKRALLSDDGKPLSKKLNLGAHYVYDGYDADAVDGYVRLYQNEGTNYLMFGGGLIMFLIRTTDGESNAQVLVDTAQGGEIYSSLFLLKQYPMAGDSKFGTFMLKLSTTTPLDPSEPFKVELMNPFIRLIDGGYIFEKDAGVTSLDKYEIFYKYLARY